MEDLGQLISRAPSAAKLLAALAPCDPNLPSLVTQVIKELQGNAQDGAVAAAATAAAPALVPAPAAAAAALPVVGERPSLAGALSSVPQLMFLHPRGKQELAFFPDHFVLRSVKADISVPYAAIQDLAIIDSIPKDTKGRVLLFLHLKGDAGVMNGKSPLRAVVIQTTADAALSIPSPLGGGGAAAASALPLAGAVAVVLCQAFGMLGVDPTCFCSPDTEAVFASGEGHAGVEAYVKARPGFLFPMERGLAFLESPPTFLPRAAIQSVELARAGGGSSTFDLYVHCRDGSTTEFSSIPRNEIGPLEAYIRKMKLAVGAAESSGDEEEASAAGAEAAGEEEDSDSDDLEDEDFNPEASSSDDEAAARKRKRGGSGGGGGGDSGAEASGEGGGDDSSEDGSASGNDGDGSSSSDDSDDDGSVELVSEDEFSRGALHSVIDEAEAARRPAREEEAAEQLEPSAPAGAGPFQFQAFPSVGETAAEPGC